MHLPLLHAGLANAIPPPVAAECAIDVVFEGNASDVMIVAPDTNSTMASGQYLTIEIETQQRLTGDALQDTTQKLEQVLHYQFDQRLNYTNICGAGSCISISLGAHMAVYSVHPFIIIDIHIRDYNYTSQYQQQRIQSILNVSSNLFNGATVKWSHKLRGFRNSLKYVRHANPLDHELGVDVLRRVDDKRLLVLLEQNFNM
jgi:hypothetical protein